MWMLDDFLFLSVLLRTGHSRGKLCLPKSIQNVDLYVAIEIYQKSQWG